MWLFVVALYDITLTSTKSVFTTVMQHPTMIAPKVAASKLDLLVNHLVKCKNVTTATWDDAFTIKVYWIQCSNASKENCILASTAHVPASTQSSGAPSTLVQFPTTLIALMSSHPLPSSSAPSIFGPSTLECTMLKETDTTHNSISVANDPSLEKLDMKHGEGS